MGGNKLANKSDGCLDLEENDIVKFKFVDVVWNILNQILDQWWIQFECVDMGYKSEELVKEWRGNREARGSNSNFDEYRRIKLSLDGVRYVFGNICRYNLRVKLRNLTYKFKICLMCVRNSETILWCSGKYVFLKTFSKIRLKCSDFSTTLPPCVCARQHPYVKLTLGSTSSI